MLLQIYTQIAKYRNINSEISQLILKKQLTVLKIKQIREYKNITQDEMVVKTGIPKRSYVDYENEKQDVSLDRLRKIAIALEVSISDLIDEKKTLPDVSAAAIESQRKTKDAIYEMQRVPLFNLEATMGLVPLVDGNGVDEEKVIDYISIPSMPSCDGAIYASGDSMYPLLKSGDMIAYKRIAVERAQIFFGEMYIVAVKLDESSTMKTIKFVHQSELGDEYIKLVSHNQHHTPKDIRLSQIAAIGLVRASIRLHN